MKIVKYGAVLIAIYLVVSSKSSAGLAGAGSSGVANVVKSFQGR